MAIAAVLRDPNGTMPVPIVTPGLRAAKAAARSVALNPLTSVISSGDKPAVWAASNNASASGADNGNPPDKARPTVATTDSPSGMLIKSFCPSGRTRHALRSPRTD